MSHSDVEEMMRDDARKDAVRVSWTASSKRKDPQRGGGDGEGDVNRMCTLEQPHSH